MLGSMKPPRASATPLHSDPTVLDASSIDALYGLDPVFEPGLAANPGAICGDVVQVQSVQCPYCGESFETLLDLSAGSASYIEDCQVCCQPIQFNFQVDHAGVLVALEVLRGD